MEWICTNHHDFIHTEVSLRLHPYAKSISYLSKIILWRFELVGNVMSIYFEIKHLFTAILEISLSNFTRGLLIITLPCITKAYHTPIQYSLLMPYHIMNLGHHWFWQWFDGCKNQCWIIKNEMFRNRYEWNIDKYVLVWVIKPLKIFLNTQYLLQALSELRHQPHEWPEANSI